MSIEWTVEDLIRNKYKWLGVPHFQRGLVWGKDSVALLLESLFYDTPCGTLILWKPLWPKNEGIKLPGAERIEYLVIDGQQRIRSIHDALAGFKSESADVNEDTESEDDSDDNGEDEKDAVWCFNLTRIPELERFLNSALQVYPLFMKVKDPRVPGNKRFKKNLIPLRIMLEENDYDSIRGILEPAPHTTDEDVINKIKSIGLFESLRQILSRRFQVIIREEDERKNGLKELVQIYNRINSGGVRVESEERAFATLVSMKPEVNKRLQDFFAEFHPQKNAIWESDDHRLYRDDILQRTKEKNFGFKLFMRTFVQTCNFHFDQTLGSSSFSFDTLSRPFIQRQLMDSGNEANFQILFDDSHSALKYVRDLLRVDLHCDSFQFLPETLSLTPVFQLLLKYPPRTVDEKKYSPLIRFSILKLMLSNCSQRDLLDLVARLRKTNNLEECSKIIRDISIPDLPKVLYNSNSLQDRYVLLLYWLERKHGAHDFSYKNLKFGFPTALEKLTDKREEVPVKIDFKPEKQHIVPYSILGHIYNLKGRARISSHSVNNIGNITYISQALNSLEGLGNKPIEWHHDSDENLKSHFLLGSREDRNSAPTRSLYNEIISNDSGPYSDKKKKYEDFYTRRIRLIAQGFVDWLNELGKDLPNFDNKPIAPIFAPTASDKVRKLGYERTIEDEVLGIIKHGASVRELKNVPVALNVVEKKSGKQLIQLRLKNECIEVKVNQPESSLARDVKIKLQDAFNDPDKRSLPVRDDGIAGTIKVLQIIANSLEGRNS
jgi:hypothetical protein